VEDAGPRSAPGGSDSVVDESPPPGAVGYRFPFAGATARVAFEPGGDGEGSADDRKSPVVQAESIESPTSTSEASSPSAQRSGLLSRIRAYSSPLLQARDSGSVAGDESGSEPDADILSLPVAPADESSLGDDSPPRRGLDAPTFSAAERGSLIRDSGGESGFAVDAAIPEPTPESAADRRPVDLPLSEHESRHDPDRAHLRPLGGLAAGTSSFAAGYRGYGVGEAGAAEPGAEIPEPAGAGGLAELESSAPDADALDAAAAEVAAAEVAAAAKSLLLERLSAYTYGSDLKDRLGT